MINKINKERRRSMSNKNQRQGAQEDPKQKTKVQDNNK
jgi:hypothetical protein